MKNEQVTLANRMLLVYTEGDEFFGGAIVKNLSMLVWFTQLGLSVALPPAGFIFLASWLRRNYGWGSWVLWIGIALGIVGAVEGLISSLKAMDKLGDDSQKEQPPVSFNEHE